ncbi:hypothetical protein [Halalkalibacter krulwichiae]|uniref:Uncharacterized protein n=1 Tax=Halalkalibacter krulwichiae TaxID=199441 RepID=A0A1X9MD36_9BACI|nr:hypothetical protein [Halalkalibacter krulwichiae]ARK30554.1 hypothetical protein BkAM31D_12330 [Halalkalibacter krulwichiae]
MREDKKNAFTMPTQATLDGEIGIRTELDSRDPSQTVDRYAGDSVDQHKELEKANEGLAEAEIKQVSENS